MWERVATRGMDDRRVATCYVASRPHRLLSERLSGVQARLETLRDRGVIDEVRVRHWPDPDSGDRTALMAMLHFPTGRAGTRPPAMGLILSEGETTVAGAPSRSATGVTTVETTLQTLEHEGWPQAEPSPLRGGRSQRPAGATPRTR